MSGLSVKQDQQLKIVEGKIQQGGPELILPVA
jgi:hypothetical protein